MLHVGELVRHHAAELALGEDAHDAGGRGNRGVLRIAAGGEGVGLVLVDEVDARHRDPAPSRPAPEPCGTAPARWSRRLPARCTCAGPSCPRTSRPRGSWPRPAPGRPACPGRRPARRPPCRTGRRSRPSGGKSSASCRTSFRSPRLHEAAGSRHPLHAFGRAEFKLPRRAVAPRRVPGGMGRPLRNSAAGRRREPGRCMTVSANAPPPQATTGQPSCVADRPCRARRFRPTGRTCQIFRGSPPRVVSAPGKGSKARTCRSRAGRIRDASPARLRTFRSWRRRSPRRVLRPGRKRRQPGKSLHDRDSAQRRPGCP